MAKNQAVKNNDRMEDNAMQNFEFYAPTRMIFGKETHKQVGKLVKEYGFKKVRSFWRSKRKEEWAS